LASAKPHIGTAGWSIPTQVSDFFPAEGTHLQRYAARFDVAEINSSFHRPHQRSTYERWAASVPEGFRFAVKIPKTITHKQKLAECGDLLAVFAEQVAGLGAKRGPLLVQLPPSFAWPGDVAERFFDALDRALGGQIVIEPRHASWYEPDIDALLVGRGIARVAADPPVPAAASEPGGWRGLTYYRLHGSPRTYWSSYTPEQIAAHAARLSGACWTIFDNTASGAAAGNAVELQALV
jgi:uncharacterized protein YecE (DUF72 family)